MTKRDELLEQLRGDPGPVGPVGPAGQKGDSPTNDELKALIAEVLPSEDKLRALVRDVVTHTPDLRGERGPVGPVGSQGPPGDSIRGDTGAPGRNALPVTDQQLREVVRSVVAKMPELRGEPGVSNVPGPMPGRGDLEPLIRSVVAGIPELRGPAGQSIEGPRGPSGEKGGVGPRGLPGPRGERGASGLPIPDPRIDQLVAEVEMLKEIVGALTGPAKAPS